MYTCIYKSISMSYLFNVLFISYYYYCLLYFYRPAAVATHIFPPFARLMKDFWFWSISLQLTCQWSHSHLFELTQNKHMHPLYLMFQDLNITGVCGCHYFDHSCHFKIGLFCTLWIDAITESMPTFRNILKLFFFFFFLICCGLTSEWEPNFGGGKFASWTADFAAGFVPRAEQFVGFRKVSSPHRRSFYPSVDPSVTAPAPQVGRANKSDIQHILPLGVRTIREDSTRWIEDVFLPHICQALFLTSWHLKSKSAGKKKNKSHLWA